MGCINMSFRQKLGKYFSKRAETGDNHPDPELETNYYRTTRDRGLMILENFFKGSDEYEFNSISKEHGEISVLKTKGKKAFIVITVIMVRPHRTAIDFSVSTESILPFDFGYSNRLIGKLYDQINKELELIK